MDSLTHGLTGALVCDALPFTKRFGPKAPLAAAIASMAPDLDMLPAIIANFPPKSFSFFGLMNEEMVTVYHRSYSHSFFYMALASIPLGWLAWRWGKKLGSWPLWSLMLMLAFFLHTILDLTNIWGVRAWLPFSARSSAMGILPLTEPVILIAASAVFFLNHLLRDSYPDPNVPVPLQPNWRKKTSTFLNRVIGPTTLGALGMAVVVGRIVWAIANEPDMSGWF